MNYFKSIYNFKLSFNVVKNWAQGQEVEFHEIEIQLFQEVEFFCKIDQEIKLALGALRELG